MTSILNARISKLEERRRPVVDRRTKAERDAQVAAELLRLRGNPDATASIRVQLQGTDPLSRSRLAAFAAAMRAHT